MNVREERGSGTVLVLIAMMVLFATAVAGVVLGNGYVARHRATAAADLAALAAAGQVLGPQQPCSVAEDVAIQNQAQLVDCVVQGSEVEVVVEVTITGPHLGLDDPRRRARAGPADLDTTET